MNDPTPPTAPAPSPDAEDSIAVLHRIERNTEQILSWVQLAIVVVFAVSVLTLVVLAILFRP